MLKVNGNIKLFSVSLMALLFLTFTGLSCGSSNTDQPAAETPAASEVPTTAKNDLSNIDPSTVNSTVTSNYNTAKQKAAEWKNDAKIYNFTEKLAMDLTPSNGTETFVFGSNSDPNNWWIFTISESTGKFLRALVPKSDYLGNTLTPINENYWKSNFLQAFQKADLYQGTTFRTANPNTEVSVNLMNGDPKGWLWWVVEYKSSNGNSLKIRVNPNDLTIVDDMGNIITTNQSGANATNNATTGTNTATTPGQTTNPPATTTPTPNQ